MENKKSPKVWYNPNQIENIRSKCSKYLSDNSIRFVVPGGTRHKNNKSEITPR